eukprot:2910527-Amphidinium_carterae.1
MAQVRLMSWRLRLTLFGSQCWQANRCAPDDTPSTTVKFVTAQSEDKVATRKSHLRQQTTFQSLEVFC